MRRILIASLLALGTLFLAQDVRAQEIRVKQEVTSQSSNLTIASVETDNSKFAFRNFFQENAFALRHDFSIGENSGLETTVMASDDEKFKFRLEGEANDFYIGVTRAESPLESLTAVHARYERGANVFGIGYSKYDEEKELNYFAVIDIRDVPIVDEILVSGGTSGIGNDKHYLAFRVPSQETRDYGYEGFAIFGEGNVFYKFRYAYGNARMGAIGHYANDGGTGPRIADIDGYMSIINEIDLIRLRALEIWQRGIFGLEISGTDKPIFEFTWNPSRKGNWIGGIYDMEEGKFSVEGGLNIRGWDLKGVANSKDYLVRVEKRFAF